MSNRIHRRRGAKGPIRAGIVGSGLMGRWHAHALTHAGGQLIAVADANIAAAQQLAQQYRVCAFAHLDELLAECKIDALHICTPLATHFDLASRALRADLHILVEKPFTPDAEQAEQLLMEAQVRGCLAVPVHQFIFQRGVQAALAGRRQLGTLVHLDVVCTTAGGENLDEAARDRLVADILPHPLALFQRFLPEGLEKVEWLVQHPAPGELRVLGQASPISPSINLSTRGRPPRNVLTVIGTHGSIQADLFHGFALFQRGQVSRARKISQPFEMGITTLGTAAANLVTRVLRDEPAFPGLRELIRAFYGAIRQSLPPPISSQEIQAVARARDRIIAKL